MNKYFPVMRGKVQKKYEWQKKNKGHSTTMPRKGDKCQLAAI